MIKYKVTDYISYKSGDVSKYLFPGDELVLIREYAGRSGGNNCQAPRKILSTYLTRESVTLYSRDFDKIELI